MWFTSYHLSCLYRDGAPCFLKYHITGFQPSSVCGAAFFSNHILHIYRDGEAIIKKTFTISIIGSRDDGTKTTLPSSEMNL